jgi:hypothetical protein
MDIFSPVALCTYQVTEPSLQINKAYKLTDLSVLGMLNIKVMTRVSVSDRTTKQFVRVLSSPYGPGSVPAKSV